MDDIQKMQPDASGTTDASRRRRWRTLMPLGALLLAIITVCAAFFFSTGNSAVAEAPTTPVRLIATYPHDQTSFCQGLVAHRGMIVEGTGLYEQSRLRVVQLEKGTPTAELKMSNDVFGEGITIWKNQILQGRLN